MTDPLGPCARFAVVLRSPHVEDGLAARLADPLWMLARQWQLGEFRGDDAGSLVSLNFEADAYAPTWWRPEPDAEHATAQPWQSWTVRTGPLEATIDAERDDGSAWLRLCIDGGVAARRALCAAGLASAAAALPAVAPWPPPGEATWPPSGTPQAVNPLDQLLVASTAYAVALDGIIAPWADPTVPMPAAVMTALGVSGADANAAATALRDWQIWWRDRSSAASTGQIAGPVDPAAWDASRLEHRGSLAFAAAPDVRLYIDRHPGGPVDWYSADITGAQPNDTADAPAPPSDLTSAKSVTTFAVPQPARLAGMPANRFWEYEDAEVDFGAIDASPADLARLLLVEYTTVYDNNWYVAPLRIPMGALVYVANPVTATDSFGQPSCLQPFAEKPGCNTRMFTPSALVNGQAGGSTPDPQWSTRWFWFAPRLATTLDSEPVEQLGLRRDENANLAWAILTNTSDLFGRAANIQPSTPAASPVTNDPASQTAPHYTLQSSLPDNWFALVPTAISASTAYLLVLANPDDPQSAPECRLLADPGWYIHEEELGDAGLTLTRTRTLGRWYDGGIYTWTGRTVWPGGGEADSGLTWDYLR